MAATLKKALAYYPVRYYAAAILVFFVLLNSAELINDFQEIMISRMLNFLGVSASISNANLFVGEIPGDSRVILPTYLEMLFLGFFPVVALTARGSLVTRFKLIGFTVLCFLMFTMILLAAIYVMHMMQVLESILTVRMVTLGELIVDALQVLTGYIQRNIEHLVMRFCVCYPPQKTIHIFCFRLGCDSFARWWFFLRNPLFNDFRRWRRLSIAKCTLPVFALEQACECQRVDESKGFRFTQATNRD